MQKMNPGNATLSMDKILELLGSGGETAAKKMKKK